MRFHAFCGLTRKPLGVIIKTWEAFALALLIDSQKRSYTMPYLDRARNKWIGSKMLDGRRKKKSFDDEHSARKWEIQLEVEAELKVCSATMGELVDDYMKHCKVRFSDKTVDEKKRAYTRFLSDVDRDTKAISLKRKTVLDHLQVVASKRSGNVANKERKNLIAMWNWGVKYIEYFPSFNPFKVDRFAEVRQPRYMPPEKDFWKVYEEAETEQDKRMLLAFIHLGARRNEIFRIRWPDINFPDRQVTLWTRKREGGNLEANVLPMTDVLYDELLAQRQISKGEYVFPDPETGKPYTQRRCWMQGLCKRAKVRHFTLHSIRHLTASLLMDAGVPMMYIRDILRHKNIRTTELYIKSLKPLRTSLQLLRSPKPTESARSLSAKSSDERADLAIVG